MAGTSYRTRSSTVQSRSPRSLKKVWRRTLLMRSCRPDLGVLARAANVEDEDLVSPGRQLGGKMIVGDRPERGVESQAMTENHRQLAGVGMLRSVVPDAQPPAVLGVRIAVGAGPQVRTRRIAAHGGTTRQHTTNRAQIARRRRRFARDGAWRLDSLPSPFRRGRERPCSPALADSIEPLLSWERQHVKCPCQSRSHRDPNLRCSADLRETQILRNQIERVHVTLPDLDHACDSRLVTTTSDAWAGSTGPETGPRARRVWDNGLEGLFSPDDRWSSRSCAGRR